jgi:Peptidase family M23
MSTTTRTLPAPPNANLVAEARSWIWPLPRLDGVAPCIVQAPPGPLPLDGVAIGYPGRTFSPGMVPVFATRDGTVIYANTSGSGSTVCLAHSDGWWTRYAELADLLTRPTGRLHRRRKERVRAGDVIGHARRSTLRIRFALSHLTDDGCVAQDPTTWMPSWSMLPWFTDPTPRVVTRVAV